MNLEAGMFAKSKAGHDKDCIYVIISVKDEYVYLADGKSRTVCRSKKKNRKHIQPIACVRCESVTDDLIIKKAVKTFMKAQKQEV